MRKPRFPARLDTLDASHSGRSTALVSKPLTDPKQDYSAYMQRMLTHLQQWGLKDERILAAFASIERHLFVDTALQAQAYEDTSLPIGFGQTISKPNVVARMLELLAQSPKALQGRVLEIGTGCGYQAALLARLAQQVYSIERISGLHEKARSVLRHYRLPNLHLLLGDGMQGFAQGAPYSGIIAAAGGQQLPSAWIEQLDVGGRIVAPVHFPHTLGKQQQMLLVVDKLANGQIQQSWHDAVHFVPLTGGII